MKKTIVLLLILIALLGSTGYVIASTVTDADYSGVIRATNNSTLASNVSGNVSGINTAALITSGILNATANNCAIRNASGGDVRFMPGYDDNPWAVFVDSVPENGNTDLTLYTGNVSGGAIRYFPGTSGMTTTDTATMEPGDNFSIVQSGFINTDNGSSKYLINKDHAISAYVSSSVAGNITSDLYYLDAEASQESLTSGDDSNAQIPSAEYWYLQTFTPTVDFSINSINLTGSRQAGVTGTLNVRTIEFNDSTNQTTGDYITTGTYDISTMSTNNTLITITQTGTGAFDDDTLYAFEISTTSLAGGFVQFRYDGSSAPYSGGMLGASGDSGATWNMYSDDDFLFEIIGQPYETITNTLTGIESGEYTANVTADGTWFTISLDGVDYMPTTTNMTFNTPFWHSESNNTTFLSKDTNAHSCNTTGATWTSDGYSFDGNDRINIAETTPFFTGGNTSFTIETWFKKDTNCVYNALAYMADSDNETVQFRHADDNNYDIYVNASFVMRRAATLTDDTWYFVHFIRDGNTWSIYQDLSLVGANTTDSRNISLVSDPYRIGSAPSGSSQFFQGVVGETRVYNRALSSTERLANYNATSFKYTTSVVDYYYNLLDGASIPDLSNDWTMWQGLPYMESSNLSVNGTLAQSIDWEYGATFTDASGYSNDATPSFRTTCTDADVSISLISFTPINIASASDEVSTEWPDSMEEAPDEPSTMYTEESRPGVFFEPLVHAIWALSGLPDSAFWYPFTFFTIIMGGMLVFYFAAGRGIQALLLKCGVMAAIMIFWALPGPNVYGMYVVIYFVLWCVGVLLVAKSWSW